MSDVIDVRSGGAIAVDTASLRAAARELGILGRRMVPLGELAAGLDRRQRALFWVVGGMIGPAAAATEAIANVADLAGELARGLDTAAAAYELVELRAERSLTRDDLVRASLDARIGALERSHPDAVGLAADAREAWTRTAVLAPVPPAWPSPSVVGAAVAGMAAALLAAARVALPVTGAGTVDRGARLVPAPSAVRLREVPPQPVAGPPRSLAYAASRMPEGEARIRVERYTTASGARAFALYVAGTEFGVRASTWGMESNVRLYTGRTSESYAATLQALRRAGAQPGDAVYAFGHSQGGAIVGRLALEGGYDTRALVTFGSPVEVDAPVLSVQVRHVGDPVVALAAGGSEGVVGAPGSVVVERAGPGVLDVGSHVMSAYEETARLADASDDHRLADVRLVLDELTGADVEAWAFRAERVEEDAW